MGITMLTAQAIAADGAILHLGGDNSSDIAMMYQDLDNGNQGYADLDAIDAALDATGSTDEATLLMVGTFFEAQDDYENPLSPAGDDGQASQNTYLYGIGL
jgi:hypothetical protein